MEFLKVNKEGGLAAITLGRGKVNALTESMVEEITGCFKELEMDDSVRAVIFSGTGKFFSFGFDIPDFLSYSKKEFTRYLTKFCYLYARIYLFPKPVVAALNGHTIAGGCMLAIACDYRIMLSGKAKISLNEITFGSSVFAGSVEILRGLVGDKNAQKILFTGAMYSAEEAQHLGLIDEVAVDLNLQEKATKAANELARNDPAAFKSIKWLLRRPIAEKIEDAEEGSIREFVDIWYSEQTWKKLQEIKIHS